MCGSPPDAPKLPQYPNQTPQEQQILQQQGTAVNQQGNLVSTVGNQLNNNQNILQMISGLFNSDGTINQSALSSLQQQTQASNKAAGSAGQSTLEGIGGTNAALGATTAAYTNALQNGAPANQQIQFQQNQNFQALKQQAAQQGIQISGDNWANAVSNSTAGQKLLQNAQQNNNIQNQNYNLGYIGQLSGNMGQIANTGATQANTGMGLSSYSQQTPLNYVQSSISNGPGALSPYLQSYEQGLQNLYQPYYMQQIGPYSQQLAQQQANYGAGLNQYNAGENQMMGWANLAANIGSKFIPQAQAA